MPWLPLAILLVAALTVASLALILFPPGEDRAPAVGDDLTMDSSAGATDDDLVDDTEGVTSGANLAPPPPDGDLPLREGDGESSTAPAPTRRDESSGA